MPADRPSESAPPRRAVAVDVWKWSVPALALLATFSAWRANRDFYELHISNTFCAVNHTQLRVLDEWRIGIAALALVAGIVLHRPVGRWAGRQRSNREALASLARMLVAALLALVVCDLGLRAKHRLAPPHSAPPSPELLPPTHADPIMGWVADAHTTVSLRVDDHDIPYAINREGFRAKSEDDIPDPDAPSILFAGESYTEGIGVRYEESYPALVANDLHIQAVESAVHGYGDDQIYLAMRAELAKLKHPLAVVTLTLPQLLERDVLPSRPRLVLTPEGTFATAAPAPEWWLSSPLRNLARSIVPYHSGSSVALARALFAASARDARARGAVPLVVMTNWGEPCLPGDASTPSLEQRLFEGSDVTRIVVNLDPAAVDHTTFHPNPSGHRALAAAIERALADAHVAAR